MRRSQFTKRLLAVIVAAIWLVYAVANLFFSWPYLESAYQRTRGSAADRLGASAEAANGKIWLQNHLQDAAGEAKRLLRQQAIDDFTIVRGRDGQLAYMNFYPYETYDGLDAYAQKMLWLSRYAQSRGTSFLYLNCLTPDEDAAGNFGGWPANDLSARADAFLYYLSGYGIDSLDARDILSHSDLDPSGYRYHTEPHWTTQACFAVFIALVDHLKAQGSSIDPDGFFTDDTQYDYGVYAQSYLGKLGKMAGATYAGYDDFTLILPRFQTDFTISYSHTDPRDDVRGNFTSTLLDRHWMTDTDAYENDLYCLYLSEVYAYRKITNHLSWVGPRVLIIGDSYMLPVAAFLATAVDELHLLSPYDLPDDIGSLLAYIEENDFDHIVVGLNPGTLYGTGWNFLEGVDPEQAAELMSAER